MRNGRCTCTTSFTALSFLEFYLKRARNGRECEIGAGEVGGQDANLLRSYTEGNCHRSPRLNHLSPKSDQHQISPCEINALQNRVVMRIKDIITHDEFA